MGLFNRKPEIHQVSIASAGLTTATTAYTSGDVLGTQQTVPTGAGSGFIVGALAVDASDVIVATGIELWLFSASTTPAADNAAASWSDADMANLVAVVPLTVIRDSALNTVVTTAADMTPIPFASTGNLYMTAITRGANAVFAGGATSLSYKLSVQVLG